MTPPTNAPRPVQDRNIQDRRTDVLFRRLARFLPQRQP